MNIVFLIIVFVSFICEAIQDEETLNINPSHRVNANGYVTCKGKPAWFVYVSVIDEDQPDNPDDVCVGATTDKDGNFEGSGGCYDNNDTDIDPYLLLYHNCTPDKQWVQCAYRKPPDMMSGNYIEAGFGGNADHKLTGINIWYRHVEITNGCGPWEDLPMDPPSK